MYLYIIFVHFFVIRKEMKKQSEKLQAIIDAGKSLFWKHGIKRVSIEEICQVAGVSKMTYYKYFTNKTALARHIIEAMAEEGITNYKNIIDSDISYDQKVKKMIEAKMTNSNDISQELFLDLYKYRDKEINDTVETIKKRAFNLYIEDFRRAQKTGDIRSGIKPEFILFVLNRITEMMTDQELVSMYSDPQHLIAEVTNFFFYGIVSENR